MVIDAADSLVGGYFESSLNHQIAGERIRSHGASSSFDHGHVGKTLPIVLRNSYYQFPVLGESHVWTTDRCVKAGNSGNGETAELWTELLIIYPRRRTTEIGQPGKTGKFKIMFSIISICNGGGYRYCRTSPIHPKANAKGLYPLHRVVAENKLGRLLEPWEEVHHVNENKLDDRPENLEVLSKSEHAKRHSKKVQPEALVCPACGKSFELRPNQFRLRRKRNKSGKIFCSRSCGSTI